MPLFGSAHYAAILGEIIQAHKQGKQLIYIHNAYQRAKRGTKAIATINGTTHDVWFWWSTLPHNSIVAINQPASSGWGVHNQHNILYIGRQDQRQSPIIAWITYKAAKKGRKWWIQQTKPRTWWRRIRTTNEERAWYAAAVINADAILGLSTPQNIVDLVQGLSTPHKQ